MSNNVRRILKVDSPATLSNDELMRAIRSRMRLSIEVLEELAALIKEARHRRMSLAEFSTGYPRRLVAVADGQLDAGLLFKFCDNNALLDAVMCVPVDTQRKLAKGGTVLVVEHDDKSGELVTSEKLLRNLSGPQCRLVFADGELLDIPAQKKRWRSLHAASRRSVSPGKTDPSRAVRVTANIETGDVVVGQFKIAPDKFTAAFKALGFKIIRIE